MNIMDRFSSGKLYSYPGIFRSKAGVSPTTESNTETNFFSIFIVENFDLCNELAVSCPKLRLLSFGTYST